jgi:hypothetical protein
MSYKISESGRQDNKAVAIRPTGYRKPQLVQVGNLGNVRAKGGRDGDHDTGRYFGR